MFKLIVCVRRRADISREEFQKRWIEHGQLFRKFAGFYEVLLYKQNYTIKTPMNRLMKTSRGFGPKYDGIGEIWWRSEEDFRRIAKSPLAPRLRAMFAGDECTFMDPTRSSGFFTDEHVFVGRSEPSTFLDTCICPITRTFMQEPVITSDGYTFEREAIEAWLAKFSVNPITFEPLSNTALIPNRGMKAIVSILADDDLHLEQGKEEKALSDLWAETEREANAEVATRISSVSSSRILLWKHSPVSSRSYLEERLEELTTKLLAIRQKSEPFVSRL